MTIPFTFGTQTGPIPLSELDADFAAIPNYANIAGNVLNPAQANITSVGTLIALSVTGNVNSGNVQTGVLTANSSFIQGNVSTNNNISAYGNVIGGNIVTAGNTYANSISATGTITATASVTGGNILTGGIVSAAGNILTSGTMSAVGNIKTQGIISATGNIVTAAYFVGNFQGNVTGNLSVGGSNTQVLFNNAGNVGAAGGLTFNTGSNTLGVLGIVSAQGNIIGNNVTVSGNLVVTGTTQHTGAVTAPTPNTGTSNNQVATTAFVSATLGALGTMAPQNAVSVAITGGSIGNAIISNPTISNAAITTSTVDKVTMTGGWTVTPSGSTLYFGFNGTNVAKLDSTGNFTTLGNITASGII
jgi:hypothetical protein